jgi:hypothetical protein
MNNGSGKDLLVELEQVREELAAWRANPAKGKAIPDSVWLKAVCAAKHHGVNPVSKALGLDYTYLKKRVTGGGRKRRSSGLVPAFVEVKPETSSAELACVIELEKGSGTRMRICVKSAGSVDWGRIKEAFLGA